MDLMNNTFVAIALIILGFGFLIFVHELGHFLVAKLVGIKTTQFAIGFGHSLITWRKGLGFRTGTTEPEYEKRIQEAYQAKQDEQTPPKEKTEALTTEQADRIAAELGLGETEYRLNYIPLGGYVKMLGQEDMDPTARSKDPRAFNNKSISARFAVICAGVIMNLIFGVIFFAIAFMSGVEFPPAIVGGIAPLSPASQAYAQGHEGEPDYMGLRLGDRITHIDGKEVGDMMDVKYATILARGGSSLEIDVQREGEPAGLTFKVTPKADESTQNLLWIGIDIPLTLEVREVLEDSDAAKAGITKKMRITAVDGETVDSYLAYHRAVIAAQGQDVTLTFTHPKTAKTAEATTAALPRLVQLAGIPANLLGLVPPVKIAAVLEDKPAEVAGIQAGDLIAGVGGQAWPGLSSFQEAIQGAKNQPIEITVWRDGQEVAIGPVTPDDDLIGVAITYDTDSMRIGQILPKSAMDTGSPIVGGSKLLAVAGQPVRSWADLQRVLGDLESSAGDGGADVTLTYELNLADHPKETTTVTLNAGSVAELARAGWGVPFPKGVAILGLKEPVVGENPLDAVTIGFEKTHQFIMQTYTMLVRLTQGTVPAKVMSGPVGIVHHGTIIAERGGWEYLLFFLGLISVNLAVINFLPIPITDGGLAIFLFAEKIKGSPVSARVQTAATVVGLAMLACVFLFVTYHDLARLFPGQ